MKCPSCGCSNLIEGELSVYNYTYLKFKTKDSGNYKTVFAYNCKDCGLIIPTTKKLVTHPEQKPKKVVPGSAEDCYGHADCSRCRREGTECGYSFGAQ